MDKEQFRAALVANDGKCSKCGKNGNLDLRSGRFASWGIRDGALFCCESCADVMDVQAEEVNASLPEDNAPSPEPLVEPERTVEEIIPEPELPPPPIEYGT
jgi:hypothetical protein